jgi:hypothetical protein
MSPLRVIVVGVGRYDLLELELLGGGTEVTTLASILAFVEPDQLDTVTKATLDIALGLGLGGKLVHHVLEADQRELTSPPLPRSGSADDDDADTHSISSIDIRPTSRMSGHGHSLSREKRAHQLVLK